MLKNKFITIKEAPKLFDKIYVVYSYAQEHIVYELDIKYVEYFSENNQIKYKAKDENKNDNEFYAEFYLKFNDDNLILLVSEIAYLKSEDYFVDKNDAYFECSKRIQAEIDKEFEKIEKFKKLQIEYKKQYENR